MCLIARRKDELERVQQVIQQQGGQVWIYPVDIAQDVEAKQCIEQILNEHKKIDVLINNAARSIRRPIIQALDRLHDFERTCKSIICCRPYDIEFIATFSGKWWRACD